MKRRRLQTIAEAERDARRPTRAEREDDVETIRGEAALAEERGFTDDAEALRFRALIRSVKTFRSGHVVEDCE